MILKEAYQTTVRRGGCRPKTSYPLIVVGVSGQRYYSPELGRWPSRDPIGEDGGVNLLAFIENRPLDAVDDLGLTVYSWSKKNDVWSTANFGEYEVKSPKEGCEDEVIGSVKISHAYIDADTGITLQTDEPLAYDDLVDSVGDGGIPPGKMWKISQGSYLGAGFVMPFEEDGDECPESCQCSKICWDQDIWDGEPGAWSGDYHWHDWTDAADFPGSHALRSGQVYEKTFRLRLMCDEEPALEVYWYVKMTRISFSEAKGKLTIIYP